MDNGREPLVIETLSTGASIILYLAGIWTWNPQHRVNRGPFIDDTDGFLEKVSTKRAAGSH